MSTKSWRSKSKAERRAWLVSQAAWHIHLLRMAAEECGVAIPELSSKAAFRQVLDTPRTPPNGPWLKVPYVREARRLKLMGADGLRSAVRAEFLDHAGMNDAVMRDAWDSQPALEVHGV